MPGLTRPTAFVPSPIVLPAHIPMDPDTDKTAAEFMRRVQGNILKGHGRPYTRLLMFRFNNAPAIANRALFPRARQHSPKLITSAWEQYLAAPRRSGLTDHEFYSVALTKWGMVACAYAENHEQFPPETGPQADYFCNNAVENGQDADPIYCGEAAGVHGVWLLAHEAEDGLTRMQERVEQLFGDLARIVAVENGFTWFDAPAPGAAPDAPRVFREPFGFREGFGNPSFVAPAPAHGPWVQGRLDRVFITEGGPHFGGSFLVFSKLEQNVQEFRATEAALRTTGKLPAGVRDPGALFIGRQRDGSPLVEHRDGNLDAFDFDGPPSDAKCPFHAHIRKANPRSNHAVVRQQNQADLEPAQFVRRSVVFDQPPPGKARQLPKFASPDYPEGDHITAHVGLLFMGYMRDIGEQFVTLRFNWFFNRTFPDPNTNHYDPLFAAEAQRPDWSWATQSGTIQIDRLPRFVRSRGDLFLYAPPIGWLESPPTYDTRTHA